MHKLTGTKGTAFTARYINRFHEMEEIITGQAAVQTQESKELEELRAAVFGIAIFLINKYGKKW